MPDRDKTAPAPQETRSDIAPKSSRPEIDAFIARARTLAPPVAAGQRGRLIFALDATMSRQPTWDTACKLQGQMFQEAAAVGGLDVQLGYFRGLNECRVSRWVSDGAGLGELMARIACQGGHTQIRKILSHARAECQRVRGTLRAIDQRGMSGSDGAAGERHFRRAVAEYVEHYHHERNHQGLDNRLIAGTPMCDMARGVRRRPRLGGLLNFYERAA